MVAMMFRDRQDAGTALARLVAAVPNLEDAVVLGLPRGGVPVAFEVARRCNLPLDILAVRKLGVPGQEELAMGAIASGGTVVLNQDIMRAAHISTEWLGAAIKRAKREIEQQERIYRCGNPPSEIDGRAVILVDDGLATGASMRAAAQSVRTRARQTIIAVPVGAERACTDLRGEGYRVICTAMPFPFDAVGLYYDDFEQVGEEEVCAMLSELRRNPDTRSGPQ